MSSGCCRVCVCVWRITASFYQQSAFVLMKLLQLPVDIGSHQHERLIAASYLLCNLSVTSVSGRPTTKEQHQIRIRLFDSTSTEFDSCFSLLQVFTCKTEDVGGHLK